MADSDAAGAKLKLDLGDDGDDDDDDVEPEEEEDDRKRSRRDDLARFFDLEAEAGSEDEDDDQEVEEGFEEALAEAGEVASATAGAEHRLQDTIRDMEEVLMNEKDVESRFGYYSVGEGEEVETDMIPTQGLQPSLLDPKLWMVRCKPGKEREVVLHLMNRYFLKLELGQQLHITSVIAPEHTKGFVFVEGEKEPQVRSAIHGVSNMFTFQATLVPLQQMTSVLKVVNLAADLKPGDWVRVKRGKHLNDLAQVHELDSGGQRVEVRLIPRLDLASAAEEGAEMIKEAKGGKGSKRSKVLAMRPKARPFNPDEVRLKNHQIREETVGGRNYYLFNNERYGEDGYLYKWMAVKSLITNDVKPTLDELESFHTLLSERQDGDGEGQNNKALTKEERLVMLANSSNIKHTDVQFVKGDSVRVVEGGEKGLTGTIKSVSGTTITVILKAPDQLEQFHPRQLVKHFDVGDHIKVLNGENKGETGFISNVVDNVAWVVNDSTLKTFSVLRDDIQKSVSVATGQLKLGNYALHDMVRLTDSRTIGVIVKIERDSFRVLDQGGTVHLIELPNMGSKVHSRDPVSFDRAQQQVTEGDLLKVVDGPHRGKQGKVVHIYRFFAFLECREVLVNGGIINVKTDHCSLIGGSTTKRRPPTAFGGTNALLMSPGHARQAGVEPQAKLYSRGRKKDAMIGQMVTINKGKYKAFRGSVREALEDTLRIELQANRRVVTVTRDSVTAVGNSGAAGLGPADFGGSAADAAMAQGGFGWTTPSRNVINTPARPQTPAAHGAPQTPLHGDSGNDDVWNPNAQTPARDDSGMNWQMDQDDMRNPTPGSSVDSIGWTPTSDADHYRASGGGGGALYVPNQGTSASSFSSFGGTPYDPSGRNTPYGAGLVPTPGGAFGQSPAMFGGQAAYTPGAGMGYSPAANAYGASPAPSSAFGVTPGYPSPSPRGPQTPGRFPGAPYEPSPSRFGGPAITPAYGGGNYTPSYTPAAGATPGYHAAATPGYHAATTPGFVAGSESLTLPADWHRVGVQVEIGRSRDKGVIVAISEDNCVVRLDGDEQEYEKSELTVVPPEVGNRVVVLAGPHLGNEGEITAIDRTLECLVNFGNALMAMIPLAILGKSVQV